MMAAAKKTGASLSARAIAADGCTVVGWVAVDIDPAMSRADDNLGLLSHCVSAPCSGRLPYRAVPDPCEFSQLLHIPIAWPGADTTSGTG